MTAHDVHKRKVRIYQWFTGLDPSDIFLVFVGWINTPTSWSERDRTVKITVVSHIEDLEIGFSVEEGNFPYIPSDLVGKAWPMVFGTVYDYPALKIPLAVEGTLLGPLGVIVGDLDFYLVDYPIYATGSQNDITKARSLQKEWYHWSVVNSASRCWLDVDAKKAADYEDQAQKIMAKINGANYEMTHVQACVLAKRQEQIDIILQQEAVMGWGDNPVAILGGEDFPQNTPVWITVDNAYFHGYFQGNLFYVDQYGAPDSVIAVQRRVPATDEAGPVPASDCRGAVGLPGQCALRKRLRHRRGPSVSDCVAGILCRHDAAGDETPAAAQAQAVLGAGREQGAALDDAGADVCRLHRAGDRGLGEGVQLLWRR